MNIQSLPLFVYLGVKALACANTDEFKDFITKMGWQYLASGSYKEVFHKKGVPFVIKFTRSSFDSNHGDQSTVAEEFNMSRIFRGLAYLFSHSYKDNTGEINGAIGFQPKVRFTARQFEYKKQSSGKKGAYLFTAYSHIIQNRFFLFDKTNKSKKYCGNEDCREANIGLDEMGRWVQFD